MTDYISREAALNFEMDIEVDPEEIRAITKGMALMSEHIKKLPAVHGIGQHCLNCGSILIWQSDYSYDDIGLEEDGLIRCLVCPDCDAWHEVYIPITEKNGDE